MNNQTALVTGGSSGIGLALAKVFAKNKYNLVLVARKQEELEKAAADLRKDFGVDVKIFAVDLSGAQAPKQVFDFCESQNIAIDVLVNNAGFAVYGKFNEIELPRQLVLIDLNIRTLTELTHLFLPQMIAKKQGKILNVASTAAFQPGPQMAIYYASKAYVLSFSEALRNELQELGIAVTALCPGGTKTNFQQTSGDFTTTRLLKKMRLMSADEVAEIGFMALMKNKSMVIPGFRNKVLAFLTRLSPRNLNTKISGWTLKQSK